MCKISWYRHRRLGTSTLGPMTVDTRRASENGRGVRADGRPTEGATCKVCQSALVWLTRTLGDIIFESREPFMCLHTNQWVARIWRMGSGGLASMLRNLPDGLTLYKRNIPQVPMVQAHSSKCPEMAVTTCWQLGTEQSSFLCAYLYGSSNGPEHLSTPVHRCERP